MKEWLLIGIVPGVFVLGFIAVTKIDAFLSKNRKAMQKRQAKEEIDQLVKAEDTSGKEGELPVRSNEEFDPVDNGVIDLRDTET